MKHGTLAAIAVAAALGGCASDPYYYQYGDSRYSEPSRYNYAPAPAYGNVAYEEVGRVVAIDVVGRRGGATGAGAVAGAIVGAVAGHEIEKRRSGDEEYRLTVELRDGRTATFVQESLNGIRVGDRVRVVDNRLYRD